MADALDRLVATAIDEIDMDEHAGEHPRIGAVDVIPFVPLGETTLDDCVEMARAFGKRIADRYDLPVYFYAAAAARSDRVKLADVRRGQYEGLKEEIDQTGRRPDFGPATMHPRAGAVAVGARPFLIAWNINLASDDVELAKRIARRVRESGGGLPKLQANGFEVHEPERGVARRAQVSMNLLDFSITPLWLVWETVRAEAAHDGDRGRRIGADRAHAPGGVPRRGRSRRRARGRPDRGAAGHRCGVHRPARPLARCRRSSSGWPRPRRPRRDRVGPVTSGSSPAGGAAAAGR